MALDASAMTSFRPFRDFLVIEPLKSALSSIIEVIQQDDKDHPNMEGRGIVLACGPGLQCGRKYQRKGMYGPLEVKVGDLVAYEGHKYYPRDPTNDDNMIMQASDVIVIEPDSLTEYMVREKLIPASQGITKPVGMRSGLRTGVKQHAA